MKQGFLIALLAFGEVVLLLLIIANHASQQPRPAVEHPNPAHKQQAATNPTGQQISPAPKEEQPPTRRDNSPDGTFPHLNATFWASFFAAVFTGLTWRVYGQIRDHTKEIERAYITLSHLAPGFKLTTKPTEGIVTDQTVVEHDLSVHVRVENNGNTPAEVLFGVLNLVIHLGELPDAPRYLVEGGIATNLHLAKGDSFKMFQDYAMNTTGQTLLEALESQAAAGMHLYVIGYVDYLDKFRRRHRRGYGRMFNPAIERRTGPLYETDDGSFDPAAFKKRNNLPFILKPGYNYDIEIDKNGQPKKQRKGWRYYTGLSG
jgi:hypothetical protein